MNVTSIVTKGGGTAGALNTWGWFYTLLVYLQIYLKNSQRLLIFCKKISSGVSHVKRIFLYSKVTCNEFWNFRRNLEKWNFAESHKGQFHINCKAFSQYFQIRVNSLNVVLILEPEFLKLFDSITCLAVLQVTFPLGVEEVNQGLQIFYYLLNLHHPSCLPTMGERKMSTTRYWPAWSAR